MFNRIVLQFVIILNFDCNYYIILVGNVYNFAKI